MMDSETYENLRNLTLLFFIEKLVEKPSRTLHDLSCQFGSKGFSKEMRQIAGGSQSGLKKFLALYPSIFTVENENVSYTCTSVVKEKPNMDYNSQAVEYFRSRLIQYGIGVQVPIKSLLGHRSQASPEVRHISGHHIKEFTQFLKTNPAVFRTIDDEDVMLAEFDQQMPAKEFKEINNLKVDKRTICKYIEFFGDILEKHGPLLVDQLLVGIGNTFPECSEFFKSVQDLTVFLKFRPQCFQVYSNLVTLTDSYKIALEHLQRQSMENSDSNENIVNMVKFVEPQVEFVRTRPTEVVTKAEKDINDKSHTVVAVPTNINRSESIVENHVAENNSQKPDSNVASVTITGTGANAGSRPGLKRESSLSQRLNSIVMKTLTDNISRDYGSKKETVVRAESFLENLTSCGTQQSEQNLEALKHYSFSKTTIVANVRKCKIIVDELIAAGQPVSLDCEGINIGPGEGGTITLMQVGNSRGSVFIFDVMSEPRMVDVLHDLLTSPKVVKVMHDCRNISVNLYKQFGIQLANVFDTQAAHIIAEMGDTNGKTESKVKNSSLNGLCQAYQLPENPLKDKIKSAYRHDQKYWARRPLTKTMIAYAACDVLLLPEVYSKLKDLVLKNATLFSDLCNENIMCHISAEEIKSKRRMRKNNADLIELRAKLDSSSQSSLVLSNREMRLLKHLELSPVDKEKLSASIKVARKLEKLSAASKYESSSESNESNPPSLNLINNPPELCGDIRKMNLDSLDAMVSLLFSAEASTQTDITMEVLESVDLPSIEE